MPRKCGYSFEEIFRIEETFLEIILGKFLGKFLEIFTGAAKHSCKHLGEGRRRQKQKQISVGQRFFVS